MKFNKILMFLMSFCLISVLQCVDSQCEFTTNQNTNGFCTSDEFCCKGFSVSNLCSGTDVCCYGSYDCTSDSNNSDQEVDTPSPCPTFISRIEWKARNPNKIIESIGPAEHIFIHHTDDGNSCYTDVSCRVRIRSLQSYHQLSKGWADIGWNFMIGGNGLIYQGLGWNKEGFHTLGWNHNSLGIGMIGNYNDEQPSEEMLSALHNLIACGLKKGFIDKEYRIHGHRDVRRTACPGHNLYKYIQTMAQFEAGPLSANTN